MVCRTVDLHIVLFLDQFLNYLKVGYMMGSVCGDMNIVHHGGNDSILIEVALSTL